MKKHMRQQQINETELTQADAAIFAGADPTTIGRWCRNIPGLGRAVVSPHGGNPRWVVNADKLSELVAKRAQSMTRKTLPHGTLGRKEGPRRSPTTHRPARPREKLAATPAAVGLSYSEAGRELGVSPDTIAVWADAILGLKVVIPGSRQLRVDPVILALTDALRVNGLLPLGKIDPALPLRQAQQLSAYLTDLTKAFATGATTAPNALAQVWRDLERIDRRRKKRPPKEGADAHQPDGGHDGDR